MKLGFRSIDLSMYSPMPDDALLIREDWLGKRRPFEGDPQLAEPALFMQEELERLLYRTGVYILQSYGCFEE